jgi:hypothetical protein
MLTNTDIFEHIKSPNFSCEKCCYITNNKKDYKKHLLTAKHIKTYNGKIQSYSMCECGKKYKHRQSLHTHRKQCTSIVENKPVDTINSNTELKEMFIKVVEQNQAILLENQEMRKLLQETIPKIGNVTNNMNTTNKFNLNFFLNEQCKDALNIMDFVNSLQIQLEDLENVGKLGYTEGISKIFIRGLQELDVFKRPVHCSDLKRETLYVKDKDAWEKENNENDRIKLAIKHIAHKNIKQLPNWVDENPASNDYETKKHLEYVQIVSESMGALTKDDDIKNYNKIIKNVAQTITIDKINL